MQIKLKDEDILTDPKKEKKLFYQIHDKIKKELYKNGDEKYGFMV